MKKMDLKILDSLFFSDATPEANNNSNPYVAFFQKKLYEVKSFSQALIPDNKPINILYDKMFYGRVNLQNIPVIPNHYKIKSASVNNKDFKLMNFVFDAYKDFNKHWDGLKRINKLNKNSLLYNFNLNDGWINPGQMYFYYMSAFFEQLRIRIKNKNTKIKNFDDFVYEFVDYVDSVTPFVPITFSNFVISKMATPFISGLCFDVNASDPTNDSTKYSQFLEDPNYAIFMKSAMKYGFIPDKHIPWRLYADIDSISLNSYMKKYDLTQENLYNKNYIFSDFYDLELLRFYMIQFYNTYILNNSKYVENELKICEKTGKSLIKTKEININSIDLESIKTNINFDRLFMKLYIFVKVRENNIGWDESRFKNTVKTFIDIKEALDLSTAMKYVRTFFVGTAIANNKQRNFYFT